MIFNYLRYIPDELLSEELREDKKNQEEIGASIATIISLFAEATDKHLEDTIMSGMIETLNDFAESVDELLEESILKEGRK